jgi:spore germination protein YaaH
MRFSLWGQGTRHVRGHAVNAVLAAMGLAACALASRQDVVPVTVWAFVAPGDATADSSLRRNAGRLDVAVTGWIALDSLTAQPVRVAPDTVRIPGRTRRFAMLTTVSGGAFHPEAVRRLAADAPLLRAVAAAIARALTDEGYGGLVFDFEGHAAEELPALLRVIRTIADSVRRRGIAPVAIVIPATDTARYPAIPLAGAADFLIVRLNDEHSSGSGPGPVASPQWVRRALARRVAEVGPGRLVAALPLYGFEWRTGQPGMPVSFTDARRSTSEAGVDLVRDEASMSLHGVQPAHWELWPMDATLLGALRDEAVAAGVTRIGLWRLGSEDPAVWRTLGR